MHDEILINNFQQLYDLIKQARSRARFVANRELLNLFWQVGAYINEKITAGSWGDKVVDQFSEWLHQKDPGIKNFDRRNLYRMREFYLAYSTIGIRKEKGSFSIVVSAKPQIQNTENDHDKIVVSAKPQLPEVPEWLSNIPWTHHIHIFSAAKEVEERVFYIFLYALNRYISPALVAEFETKLIDKGILNKLLNEWSENME